MSGSIDIRLNRHTKIYNENVSISQINKRLIKSIRALYSTSFYVLIYLNTSIERQETA
jgi:hypothetical protein